jgi:hypothetical protein
MICTRVDEDASAAGDGGGGNGAAVKSTPKMRNNTEK